MTLQFVETFDDLTLPDEHVVVADGALPARFLDALDDPLLVDAGESLKGLDAVEELAGRVLERRSSRPLTVVAVGGGSVGDAVGFLASILWRGVKLWHVPTTALAMVDSAHGGKTAVNLGEAKNQLGTFYPAERVVIVEEALATLPLEQRRDGLVELVKGLWLGGEDALDDLEAGGGVGELADVPFESVGARLTSVLERAIQVKEAIVEQDMRETKGIRTFLNFGHTVAHALELHTGISHGQAVGWGLLAASFASERHGGLGASSAARLRRQVSQLMTPEAVVRAFDDREAFCEAVARDKKQVDGQLRSVLLDAPGEPRVVEMLGGDDWFEAFRRAVEWFEGRSVTVRRRKERPARVTIEASKSEMNRALVIEYLRPGATEVEGRSRADDVAWLRGALEGLNAGDGEQTVYCGAGGTTFRFLMAVAASRGEPTVLLADDALLERPHGPLREALVDGGAEIESIETEGGSGVRVVGWEEWPGRLSVDASNSSQYASAIALLAASGEAFDLELAGGEVASRPYLEMTLALLDEAGVVVEETSDGYRFSPGAALDERVVLEPEVDASSAAVWIAGGLVGVDAEIAPSSEVTRQPDGRIAEIVDDWRVVREDEMAELVVDLGESPDLAPVLAAVATQIAPAVELVGAAHLRDKESDRIGDLARAFDGVGVEVGERADGLSIPAGGQRAEKGAVWQTAGDHRLAMAGLLLTGGGEGEVVIDEPVCVAKSYPDFWHHARQLGWRIAFITGSPRP